MVTSSFNNLIAGDKPVLVEFYADWCEPCKWVDPILVEVNKMMNGKALTFKVNIDEFPDLKEKYTIRSVPVLIIYKKGQVMWRMNGFTYANELSDKLLQFV